MPLIQFTRTNSARIFGFMLYLQIICSFQVNREGHPAIKVRFSKDGDKHRTGEIDIRMSSQDNIDTADEDNENNILDKLLMSNPVGRIIKNGYSALYWFPRRNLPYDSPWLLFKNTTQEFLAYYQIPHNLPPYRYLGKGHPDDFFCWGLPGNTLPLGDWDPFGFQLVSPKVVKKYRESELKHCRLAMLGTVGFIVQETWHPLYPNVGGLAITHMSQLSQLQADEGLLQHALHLELDQRLNFINQIPLDYILFLGVLLQVEVWAFKKNWNRWKRNEYNHQFDHNIGIGNLKDDYKIGNYGFDPLNLSLKLSPKKYRRMQEKELNNGRLAMIAFIGMLAQEYITGLPVLTAFSQWISSDEDNMMGNNGNIFDIVFNIIRIPELIFEKFQQVENVVNF
eukprot:gene7823-15999_t